MLTANQKLWVEALRSGKFEQGSSRLNRDGKLCCLGVACEVAIANGLTVRKTPDRGAVAYDGQRDALPASLREWLEISGSEGTFYEPFMGANCLTYLNDKTGLTFSEIADFIESEPEGLFVEVK